MPGLNRSPGVLYRFDRSLNTTLADIDIERLDSRRLGLGQHENRTGSRNRWSRLVSVCRWLGEIVSERWKPHSIGADWPRINRLRLRCFRFRKCKNLLHLTVGGVF
jgi:hypothetical protein